MSADGQPPRAALPPPSRADLARLRRGELEPDAVAALLERMAGLAAPAAPPEGDLVPNGSGWRIGVGELRQWQFPRFSRWFDRWGLGILFFTPGLASFAPSRMAAVAVAGAGLGAFLSIDVASSIAWRRQLKRARRVEHLTDLPEGTVVRVEGVIPPQKTVPTLFRGVPAVLARNRMGGANEMRGMDFLLDLDGGEQARVAVRRGFLLDPLQRIREEPSCGPVTVASAEGATFLQSEVLLPSSIASSMSARYESSVGPGDRIEVCGLVRQEHAPDGGPRFFRQMPTRAVLAASEDTPLLVRRIR